MRRVIALALCVGCGNKPDAGVVNALVDTAKNPKLHFTAREVTIHKGEFERTFSVVVPDGWRWDAGDNQFYADPSDRGASFAFTSSCNGEPCKLGDFKPEIESNFNDQVKVRMANVVKNSSTPNERKFVTEDGALVAIERFWWSGETPTEYFGCTVIAPIALEPSRAAFEKACDLATVRK